MYMKNQHNYANDVEFLQYYKKTIEHITFYIACRPLINQIACKMTQVHF